VTIPSTYKVAKLSDYVYYQEGPGIRNYQNTTEGINFLNIRCFVNGRLDTASMKKVAESEALGKYRHFLLDVGDYVVSSSGTLGRIAEVYPEDLPVMLNTSTIRFRPIDNSLLDRLYLRYFLESDVFQRQVKSLATGSVQLNYGPSHLAFVEMPLPAIEIQTAIGKVLDSITRMIELNSRSSKTLEDIAQTIFKSWFIDFDPVKAKMTGETPAGMDAATAALFPDSMEESELGLIPRGWEVRNIGSLCETLLGGTPSRKRDDFWGGAIPWINSGKVNDFRICTPSEFITELGLEKSATKLLPKGTTVLAITGATLGQFSRLEFDTCANQSVVGILGSAYASNEFVFLSIKNGIQRLVSAQTGGAQQHINKEDVNAFPIVYPGKALMVAFTNSVEAMFSEIGVLLNQSNSLAKIRDALLPRLISGELQIPEEMLAS
jgi:type I restriction enzyme, S subunit